MSDWQGIPFQNPFLGVSWYQKSYLVFSWMAVWDKELDAVGLLWEIIPGGRSRGLERNGKWKERKPIQRHIIKLVTTVGTGSLILLRVLWELCELCLRIVRIIWHRRGDSWCLCLYSSVVKGCPSKCQLPHIPQFVPVPEQLDGLLQASHVLVAEKPYAKSKRCSMHLRQGHDRAWVAVAAKAGA